MFSYQINTILPQLVDDTELLFLQSVDDAKSILPIQLGERETWGNRECLLQCFVVFLFFTKSILPELVDDTKFILPKQFGKP
jgi:hypothetical protein